MLNLHDCMRMGPVYEMNISELCTREWSVHRTPSTEKNPQSEKRSDMSLVEVKKKNSID